MHKAEELIVHVGFAKTGTTAIQEFLFSKKAELAAEGTLWPGDEGNHFHLQSLFANEPQKLIQIGRLRLDPKVT